MEDLTLRYYDAEMRYLREAAKEFAQSYPDRAAMLDLDKAGTPDPVNNTWRIVLSRDDLDPDSARIIEAGSERLTLKALKDE
ncbi:hypothetical protein CRI67_07410 [Escherichia sp. E4702]|nr:hypothetical protein CRI67_07410 [Escherichia sp. E4702]